MSDTRYNAVILRILGDPQKIHWRVWSPQWWRVDRLWGVYKWASIVVSVFFLILGFCLLNSPNNIRSGAHLLIAAVAVASFGLGTVMRRMERIGEITNEVLVIWRGRRDELWKDKHLSRVLSEGRSTIDAKDRFRLTNYLHTVFDVFEYAIHLISNGYFPSPEDVAGQYVGLIEKALKMPHVMEIWREESFQDEYSQQLRDVVKMIIDEMRTE